jgi:hypothetical protein
MTRPVMARLTAISILALSLPVLGSPALQARADNDGIHLAVSPACGSATSSKAVDHNNGIPALSHFKTIVAFGVSMDPISNATYNDI